MLFRSLGGFGTGCCGDLAITNRLHDVPAFRIAYVLLPPQPTGGAPVHLLFCDNFDPGNSWHLAAGVADPVRVWASEGDPYWAYTYDANPGTRGLYATRGPAPDCLWIRDDLATKLATGLGAFSPSGDPLWWTTHNQGIPVTADRKSTRLNSSHIQKSRMPSSA